MIIKIRRAEWRVGGPRARECGVQWRKWRGPRALGCSGLGVFHAVGRSVWVQQHCGVWVLHSSGLLVWWCLPLLLLYQRWNTLDVSITARVRLWVEDAIVSFLLGHHCE